MKKILSIGVALGALAAASGAIAADIPGRKSAPAPFVAPPLFTWTGFYAGVNADYSWSQNNNARYIGSPGYVALGGLVPQSYALKPQGFHGGVQAGYNYQVGSAVFGVEADLQVGGTKKSATVIAPLATGTASTSLNAYGTIRGRAGFLLTDRWLAYVTGGLIVGQTKQSGSITGTAAPIAGAFWSGSQSKTKAGWTIGAGTEYAITNNITAKLEYLYYDLGKSTLNNAPQNAIAVASGVSGQLSTANRGHIARVGVNYKF